MNRRSKSIVRLGTSAAFLLALACAHIEKPPEMTTYENEHGAEPYEIVEKRYPELVERAESHYNAAAQAQADKEQELMAHHANVAFLWWRAATTRSQADDMVIRTKNLNKELAQVQDDLTAAQKQERLAESALARAKEVIALQGQVADSEGATKARDAINAALAALKDAERVDADVHAKSKFQEAESKLDGATAALKDGKVEQAQTLAQEAETAASSAKAEANPKYAATKADHQRTAHQRAIFDALSKINGVKASIVEGGVKVTIVGSFEHNGVEIKPMTTGIFSQIADVATKYKDISLVITGHTDSKGRSSQNLQLSDSRAKSVMSYLSSKGVAPGRITALGKGSQEPVAENKTKEGRAQNRRIEILFSTPGV